MNYQSLFSTLYSLAESLGFHPTDSSQLHETLLREGFPIASFSPIVVTSKEGQTESQREFLLEVKFMCDKGVGASLRREALCSLMDSAERFAALLGDCSAVAEVRLEHLSPEERVLTIAGECAVCLRVAVVAVDCEE